MSSFDSEIEAGEYETLASLAEDLVFRLPGCADLMVRKTIESVYRDFCKKTCCIVKRRVADFSTGEWGWGLSAVTSGCVVDCVTAVRLNGRELVSGKHYNIIENTLFIDNRFLPASGDSVAVEIETVEIPKIGVEVVPRWFVQKYGDAVTSGVLAKLMSMTGRPWSDANQAVLEMRNYEGALTETRVRRMDGGCFSAGKLNFIGTVKVL